MPDKQGYDNSPEHYMLHGVPVWITQQVAPGDMLALSVILDPTPEEPNRCRISAVKVTGLADA